MHKGKKNMSFQEEERKKLLTLDDDESDEGLESSNNSQFFDGIIKILLILLSPLLYILSLLKMLIGLGSQKEKTCENKGHKEKYPEAEFLTKGFEYQLNNQHKVMSKRRQRFKISAVVKKNK